jgi:histidine ammonia-lyase
VRREERRALRTDETTSMDRGISEVREVNQDEVGMETAGNRQCMNITAVTTLAVTIRVRGGVRAVSLKHKALLSTLTHRSRGLLRGRCRQSITSKWHR